MQGEDRTLVVVCGDHGMSDQGSHGGSSHYETSTPLILLSKHLNTFGTFILLNIYQFTITSKIKM